MTTQAKTPGEFNTQRFPKYIGCTVLQGFKIEEISPLQNGGALLYSQTERLGVTVDEKFLETNALETGDFYVVQPSGLATIISLQEFSSHLIPLQSVGFAQMTADLAFDLQVHQFAGVVETRFATKIEPSNMPTYKELATRIKGAIEELESYLLENQTKGDLAS